MTNRKKEAHTAASIRYNSINVKQVKINLNRKTDRDIIDHLAGTGNVQGYIKDLIRKDMGIQRK